MKRTLPLLLCALAQPLACPGDGSPPTTASFARGADAQLRVRGGGGSHVHVWAELDDELSGWFLLDTGAQGNRLDKSVAERLGLELSPAGRVHGVRGSVRAFHTRADSLQLGSMTLDAPAFVVADVDDDADGLIGALGSDVFERCVMVFDNAGPSVALHDPADFTPPPVEWEPCTVLDQRPFARMQIEGRPALLEIDTGGGEAVLLCTPAVERLGLLDGRDVVEDSVSGNYGSAPVRKATLDAVRVGAQTYRGVRGTLGVEHTGWLGSTEHDGLIGAPLLSAMVVILDMPGRRVAFTDRRLYARLDEDFDASVSTARSARQAVGAPDTRDKGTYANAWWPADNTGEHRLELSYAAPVRASALRIWGTYGQGALTRVSATDLRGVTHELAWRGEVDEVLRDGLARTSGELAVEEPITALRLEFDCSLVEGTNIVDAVGLVDAEGRTHWAAEARANDDGPPVEPPPFELRAALASHVERLRAAGQEHDAERVQRQLDALPD